MSAPSYASVAAKDAPPPSMQPHADPALLTTEPPSHDNIVDDIHKVNLVSPSFKDHPATTTSIQDIPPDSLAPAHHPAHHNNHHRHHDDSVKDRARNYAHALEGESIHLWARAKDVLLRPAVAGGLLGVVNVGLLSWASYALYTTPALRHDTRRLVSGAAAALALFGAEGYAAESFLATPEGREEERKARREGAALYRHAREVVLRPGVLGGIFGFLNLAVLGAVGTVAYQKWDLPRWDRRVVSAVSVGVLALFSGEGIIAEKHRKPAH